MMAFELSGRSARRQRFSLYYHGNDDGAIAVALAPYADMFRGCARVLDVGCGPGTFLELLQERGVAGVGVDVDPEMVAECQEHGFEAYPLGASAIDAVPGRFDAIHAGHLIEHMHGEAMVAFLEACHAKLKGDGILLVRTPNGDNEYVRNGGFWLDHTHVRPYPLALLVRIFEDIGFAVTAKGKESIGWEDLFLVGRKRPGPKIENRRQTAFLYRPSWGGRRAGSRRDVLFQGRVDLGSGQGPEEIGPQALLGASWVLVADPAHLPAVEKLPALWLPPWCGPIAPANLDLPVDRRLLVLLPLQVDDAGWREPVSAWNSALTRDDVALVLLPWNSRPERCQAALLDLLATLAVDPAACADMVLLEVDGAIVDLAALVGRFALTVLTSALCEDPRCLWSALNGPALLAPRPGPQLPGELVRPAGARPELSPWLETLPGWQLLEPDKAGLERQFDRQCEQLADLVSRAGRADRVERPSPGAER